MDGLSEEQLRQREFALAEQFGGYIYEAELLQRILEEVEKLDEQDVEGNIWWNKFFRFITGKGIYEHEIEKAEKEKEFENLPY